MIPAKWKYHISGKHKFYINRPIFDVQNKLYFMIPHNYSTQILPLHFQRQHSSWRSNQECSQILRSSSCWERTELARPHLSACWQDVWSRMMVVGGGSNFSKLLDHQNYEEWGVVPVWKRGHLGGIRNPNVETRWSSSLHKWISYTNMKTSLYWTLKSKADIFPWLSKWNVDSECACDETRSNSENSCDVFFMSFLTLMHTASGHTELLRH